MHPLPAFYLHEKQVKMLSQVCPFHWFMKLLSHHKKNAQGQIKRRAFLNVTLLIVTHNQIVFVYVSFYVAYFKVTLRYCSVECFMHVVLSRSAIFCYLALLVPPIEI